MTRCLESQKRQSGQLYNNLRQVVKASMISIAKTNTILCNSSVETYLAMTSNNQCQLQQKAQADLESKALHASQANKASDNCSSGIYKP